MDPWAFFDLPAHADKPMLKRAYAQKLKAMNPEDDPEGFQILRLAYEAASELLAQTPFSFVNTPVESSTGILNRGNLQWGTATRFESNTSPAHPSPAEGRKVKAGDSRANLASDEGAHNQGTEPTAEAYQIQNPGLNLLPSPLDQVEDAPEALSRYLAKSGHGDDEDLQELTHWLAVGHPSRRCTSKRSPCVSRPD